MKKLFLLAAACTVALATAAQTADTTAGEAQLRPMDADEILTTTAATAATEFTAPGYELSKWRFAVDAAYSYRVARKAENQIDGLAAGEWEKFVRGLKNGVSYGADLTYFFNPLYGVGAKFAGNRYASKLHNMEDVVNTYYFAPQFVARMPTKNQKNMWIFALSVGYVGYHETVTINGMGPIDGMDVKLGRGGAKTTAEVGFDFRVGKGVFMGLKIVAATGAIQMNLGSETQKESLNAIEIGGGVRF